MNCFISRRLCGIKIINFSCLWNRPEPSNRNDWRWLLLTYFISRGVRGALMTSNHSSKLPLIVIEQYIRLRRFSLYRRRLSYRLRKSKSFIHHVTSMLFNEYKRKPGFYNNLRNCVVTHSDKHWDRKTIFIQISMSCSETISLASPVSTPSLLLTFFKISNSWNPLNFVTLIN